MCWTSVAGRPRAITGAGDAAIYRHLYVTREEEGFRGCLE